MLLYRLVCTLALTSFAFSAHSQPVQTYGSEKVPEGRAYSPYPGEDFPNQVFFGDTHLHTSYSIDAGMIGNTLGPSDAYRFAKGDVVTSSMGVKARLQRPLDFLVVADHAEGLGIAPMVSRSDPLILANPVGREVHDLTKAGKGDVAYDVWMKSKLEGRNTLATDQEFPKTPWSEIINAAEAANQPGQFTAFIGYEWGSMPDGNNLHRVSSTAMEKNAQIRAFHCQRTLIQTHKHFGSGWPPTRKLPVVGCLQYLTMAISQMA